METIPIPDKIHFKEGKNKFNTIITIEPCFPGHGLTLGNALRRNLLSTLPGAAVIAFKIKGPQHEFSALKGIKEDVLDISLNLKQLRFRVYSEQPIRLELKAKGEKQVTAEDITPNSDIEVINKDLIIAHLTEKNSTLDMEILVSRGRGYITAESREAEKLEVGMISIDSNFTPIKRVGFNVENVRVGQMTNWDRLILDIETDGTITPPKAMVLAVQDLLNHFNYIFNTMQSIPDKEGQENVEEKIIEAEKPIKKTRKSKKDKPV